MQPFRKAPAGWNRKYKNADENSEKEIRRKVKGKENEEKEDERKTKEKGEEKKPMTGKESRETVILRRLPLTKVRCAVWGKRPED